MRKLVVTEFISLDGVMEDPGGSEGTPIAAWSFKFDRGDEGNKLKLDETMDSDAMLLGRVTYEGFAEAWPQRTDDMGFAEKFNGMPKYVVSTTLKDPAWNNSHVVDPDNLVDEVNRLKQEGDGLLVVHGSNTLIQALMEHDLVDEYRLMVHPVILGSGKRMFKEGAAGTGLTLTDYRKVGPDVLLLTYAPAVAKPAE
jgi:dihydrofolate reductase